MSKHRTRWSDEEIATLRRLTLDGMSYAEIAQVLERTKASCSIKAFNLGITNPKWWSNEEITTLTRMASDGRSYAEIASVIGRTEAATTCMAAKLNIVHTTWWSDEEVANLRKLILDGRSYAAIAEVLKRTEASVNMKACKLNLRHPRVKRWTAAELAKAKRLYDAGNTVQQIARILQRTHTGVSSTMTAHGLLDTSRQGGGRRKSDPQVYVLRKRGLMLREILLVLGRDDSENSRKALRMWLEAYCARLGVDVPPASTPRKKPDMALVEAVRTEIASLTGSTSKYEGSIRNEGARRRTAA